LLQTYNVHPALELLSKDEDELLQVFTNLSKTGSRDPNDAEIQKISLIRCLLELSGGRKYLRQHIFHDKYSTNNNANLYGSLIGITRSNCFGNFDSQKMLNALSTSPVFTNDDIQMLNAVELSTEMIASLPIGFS
jgi:hypothetical protein